jgi:hypothetical protein
VVTAVETTSASNPPRSAAAEVVPRNQQRATAFGWSGVAVELIDPHLSNGNYVVGADTRGRPQSSPPSRTISLFISALMPG